ncbi:hypothetical protein [Streptomyces sp. NPDC020917]|uniref:hypothetical protein n=1 Tax=Streptomyces sp. NPDC020917 TaxID=3365102 RepID=UPI0037A2C5E0
MPVTRRPCTARRSLLADRRVLILLDNAATASQVRPLLPGSGGSLVIVTSRDRLAGLAIRDGARRLTLGTLPEAEAVALLRAVTSDYRPQDDEQKYQRSAMLHRRLGDRSREALTWRGTGRTYAATERPEEAAAFHRQAAAVHRELRDTWELAVELHQLAEATDAGDPAAARTHRTEALTHLTPFTDPRAHALRALVEQSLAGHG